MIIQYYTILYTDIYTYISYFPIETPLEAPIFWIQGSVLSASGASGKDGLVTGHAYSILNATEPRSGPTCVDTV